jgi:hypothetical protein
MRKNNSFPVATTNILPISNVTIERFKHDNPTTATIHKDLKNSDDAVAVSLRNLAIIEGGEDLHDREMIFKGMMMLAGMLSAQHAVNELNELFKICDFSPEPVSTQE